MISIRRSLTLLVGIIALVGLACNLAGAPPSASPSPVVVEGAIETAVYETVAADLTASAPAATSTPLALASSDTPEAQEQAASTVTQMLTPMPPGTPTPTDTPPAPAFSPTPIHTPTETPRPQTTPVLRYRDDFEHGEAWYTVSTDAYTFEYVNGAYQILNELAAALIWSVHENTDQDVRVEVDAMYLDGPKDGFYGLVCRYQDGNNYYAFVIGPDDFYGIGKMEKGVYAFLVKGTAEKKLYKQDDVYNHLQADCFGSILTLFVNGKKVGESRDSTFASGNVGMLVGNGSDETGAQAQFDNFTLWSP